MQHTILKLQAVMAATQKGRSAIYQEVKRGDFPAPIKLGKRSVGWTTDSINRWIESRIAASQVQA